MQAYLKYRSEIALHLGSAAGTLQRCAARTWGGLTRSKVLQYRLAHDFCLAVWTVGLKTCCFGNRNDWGSAVNGCTRRVDDLVAVELVHDLQQVDSCCDVVFVVCQWDLC